MKIVEDVMDKDYDVTTFISKYIYFKEVCSNQF